MPLILELVRFLVTSVGVGILNEKFNLRPQPPGQVINKNVLQNVLESKVFPYIAGACIQHPALVATPVAKTTGVIVRSAGHISTALWGSNTPKEKKGNLVEIADFTWLLVDKLVAFGIQKPKVVIFCVTSSFVLYLLLEPVAHSYLEARELNKIKRKLSRRLEEERLIKEVQNELNAEESVSEIVPYNRLESDLNSLTTRENRVKNGVIKVLNSKRKG